MEISIKLAHRENQLIMQGQPVVPLPYSSAVHTAIHVRFMESPAFQELPAQDPRVAAMTDLVMTELAAQAERQGQDLSSELQGAGQFNSQVPQAQGGANNELANLLPGKIQGGEQVKAQFPV